MTLRLQPVKVWITAAVVAFLFSGATILWRNSHKPWLVFAESLTRANRLSSLPPVILWAWERPEQLDFIDPQNTGVAFLASTIHLRGDKLVTRPRLQPLQVTEGTKLIAVSRLESDRKEPPTLNITQLKEAASGISELARLPNVTAVQVDFDATLSQREFYRNLVFELRKQLPESTALSITALASWCQGDNWLDDLPLDEAVPMLFRMGVESKQFLSKLELGEEFDAKPCQDSVGISIDEPLPGLPPVRRIYVFSPAPWSSASVNNVMDTYQK